MFGLNLAMPTQKMLGVETQSSYYPQYAMYFADTQRMMMNFAYGWKYSDTLSVGLGLHFYLVTGSTVRTVLPATDPSDRRTSNLDVKLEVKPAVAPSLGLIQKFGNGHTMMFSYIGLHWGIAAFIVIVAAITYAIYKASSEQNTVFLVLLFSFLEYGWAEVAPISLVFSYFSLLLGYYIMNHKPFSLHIKGKTIAF